MPPSGEQGDCVVISKTLTQLPLEFTQAAQRGGDEVSILALYVLEDVLPVQTDGFRHIQWAVQVSQQSATQMCHNF